MSRSLQRIAARRRQLQALASAQRLQLAEAAHPWQQPLAFAGQVYSLAQSLAQRPLWLLAGTAVIAALPAGRVRLWLQGGWLAMQMIYALPSRPAKTGGATR